MQSLRARQRLGKYRLDKRLATGGFAVVYKAFDVIEGMPVALKVPHRRILTRNMLGDIQKEVRVTTRMVHPHILPIKNATFIDDYFVIAYPLGQQSLEQRLRSRMTAKTALSLTEQLLDAVAYAHDRRVIHCDIKPDNIVLFPGDDLQLTDFGIAKVALRTRTLYGSGTGTVGYVAPEQALGKPSFRSDVFSTALVIYRMFTGELPEWPYEWPPPGYDKLKRALHPDFVDILRRSMEVNERKRPKDGVRMRQAFERIKTRALRSATRRRRRAAKTASDDSRWQQVMVDEFKRRFGRTLTIRSTCSRCEGPMSEPMQHCPWCGKRATKYAGHTTFPFRCPRCARGMKSDWRFCAWCYGPEVGDVSTREYADRRYSGRCHSAKCTRKVLLPFSRYCPWCRTKVRKRWKIPRAKDSCKRCGWGVLPEFWAHCPWCGRGQGSG